MYYQELKDQYYSLSQSIEAPQRGSSTALVNHLDPALARLRVGTYDEQDGPLLLSVMMRFI